MWRADTTPDSGTPWLATPALYGIFAEWNVVALGVLRPGSDQPIFYDPDGRVTDGPGLCGPSCRAVLADPALTGNITTTRVYVPKDGPFAGRRLTALILPLANDAGGRGGLVLVVDAMMGFDSPEAMLRTASDFRRYYPDPAEYEFIRVTLETRGSVSDHQVRVRRYDGRVIWISTSVMPGVVEYLRHRRAAAKARNEEPGGRP